MVVVQNLTISINKRYQVYIPKKSSEHECSITGRSIINNGVGQVRGVMEVKIIMLITEHYNIIVYNVSSCAS